MRKIIKMIGIGLFSATLLLAGGCNESDPPEVSVSRPLIEADYMLHSIDVEVRANGAWTGRSDVEWCRLSKTSGRGTQSIAIIVDENPGTTDRTAHVRFTTGDEVKATASILVTQQGDDTWNGGK